jgi:hypothetical protein
VCSVETFKGIGCRYTVKSGIFWGKALGWVQSLKHQSGEAPFTYSDVCQSFGGSCRVVLKVMYAKV